MRVATPRLPYPSGLVRALLFAALLVPVAACGGGSTPLAPAAVAPTLPTGLPPATGSTVVVAPCVQLGQSISVDLSTGLSVPYAAADTAWQLVMSAGVAGVAQAHSVDRSGFGAWVSPTNPNVHWLQPNANATGSPPGTPDGATAAGIYVYRLVFDLPTTVCNPVLLGSFSADNHATITLNGASLQTCVDGFPAWHVVVAGSALFNLGGLNLLEVTVDNTGGYSGMAVEATLQATCCGCAPAPQGMVAWYPLDESTGAAAAHDVMALDNVGAPSPGGVVGPGPVSSVPGVVQGALYFASGRVEVPSQAELDFGSGDFSIDAWVKPVPAAPGAAHPIVDKYTPAAGYALLLRDGALELWLNGGAFTSPPLPLIPANAWTHVAVTVERVPGTITYYVDGASASLGLPLAGPVTNALPLWIGASRLGASLELAIDELELFNTVVPAADIQAIVAAGGLGKCRDPLQCVQVFFDANGDGVRAAAGEAWLPGWEIVVKDIFGVVVAHALTAPPDGSVCFTLPPGTYTITLTPQGGSFQTLPSGGGGYTVTLGNTPTPTLLFGVQ